MVALLTSLLFALALAASLSTIVASILPQRRRIWALLTQGPEVPVQALATVRLSSRRGLVRQRPAAAPALRAAA